MIKEFSLVFCTISLYLIGDADMVPLPQISQWSGQINGLDSNRTYYMPGFGMGNGGGGNGMNGGNGMGSGGNEMGNGFGSNGAGNNMGGAPGNGFGGMGGAPGNGFGGMSGAPSNGGNGGNSNWSYSNIQSHANGVPGSGYPASYYQQYSNQSIIVPTPANIDELQNTTAPNPNGYMDQMNGGNMGNMGNMGNNNNPSAFQFQGCVPQSSFGNIDPVPQGSNGNSTDEATTTATTVTAATTESSDGSEDSNTSTTILASTETPVSTRKRNKH